MSYCIFEAEMLQVITEWNFMLSVCDFYCVAVWSQNLGQSASVAVCRGCPQLCYE